MKPDPSSELATTEILNDDTVSKYLIENPEFFNRKADLLMELTIPHESGAAISLLERQVGLFRERNRELQHNINDFIFNAEENDALFEKTRIVILSFLKADTLVQISEAVEETLRSEFAAHASRLFFITNNKIDEDVRVLPETATRETMGQLFEKKRTFCCELDGDQAQLLFPDTKKDILSSAVIPVHLGENSKGSKAIGMPVLIIGSEKPNHFNSSLDTLFLDFIGEILAAHITRLMD